MPDRSPDWFAQALRNIEQAKVGRHEWSCFAAQQAAEMAIKAVHLKLGQEGWGHVVRRLLQELPPPIQVPGALIEGARILDAYYIPTRYPNGHSAGAPGEHYGETQSQEAIRYAREIIEFCRIQMAGS